MTTLLYSHAACLEHDTGYDHPESVKRLSALLKSLSAPEFDALDHHEVPRANRRLYVFLELYVKHVHIN